MAQRHIVFPVSLGTAHLPTPIPPPSTPLYAGPLPASSQLSIYLIISITFHTLANAAQMSRAEQRRGACEREGQCGGEKGRLAGGGGCCDRWAAAGCSGWLRFYVTAWWLLLTIWMMMMLRSLCCCHWFCCCLCLCLCCCCVNPGKNKQKLDEKHILQDQEKNQNANSHTHKHALILAHSPKQCCWRRRLRCCRRWRQRFSLLQIL